MYLVAMYLVAMYLVAMVVPGCHVPGCHVEPVVPRPTVLGPLPTLPVVVHTLRVVFGGCLAEDGNGGVSAYTAHVAWMG